MLRDQLQDELDFAFAEFGMRDEEFFSQTPRQWHRRYLAWKARERRLDLRTARVCTVLAWCHGDASARPEDFVPQPVTIDDDTQTPEEMLGVLTAVTTSHGK